MKSTLCLDDFEKCEFLGEGTYGIVYKAKNKKSNEVIAVKSIKLESREEGIPSTTLREISILRELSPHLNIIQQHFVKLSLKDVLYQIDANKLDLIFEYTDFDLRKYLASRKDNLSKIEIKLFMYQLIKGVDYCHSKRIIHRDLKPQNILVTQDQILKIADFGLARVYSLPIKTLTHQIETLWYRAPEILLGQKDYSLGVDIWAVGCIFAELIQKKALFRGDSEIDQIFKIFQILGTPTKQIWPTANQLPYFKNSFPRFSGSKISQIITKIDLEQLQLLQKMLQLDPLRRISMKNVLQDKYFDEIKPQIAAMYERSSSDKKKKPI